MKTNKKLIDNFKNQKIDLNSKINGSGRDPDSMTYGDFGCMSYIALDRIDGNDGLVYDVSGHGGFALKVL